MYGGEDVDLCEVLLPAVGVGEALHQAEEENTKAGGADKTGHRNCKQRRRIRP